MNSLGNKAWVDEGAKDKMMKSVEVFSSTNSYGSHSYNSRKEGGSDGPENEADKKLKGAMKTASSINDEAMPHRA